MKKIIIETILILCIFGCAGCKKEKKTEIGNKYESISGDFNEDTGRLMITDKGYYYYSYAYGTYGYRYGDKETGNDMFLCNKPECKHDGNPFCVATNKNYRVLNQNYIYDGRLIVAVIDETDTNYEFKLMELALDGSEASEICTYYRLVKDGFVVTNYGGYKMYIHRDKAFLPMNVIGTSGMEDTERFGVAIVDLKTYEVSYLDEEPLSKENIPTTDITAYGDYFYYCRKEGKKNVLHRYHIIDGTDEKCRLLTNFTGDYAVLEEDYIVYLRRNKETLCTYRFSTGENEEKVMLYEKVPQYDIAGNLLFETEEGVPAVGLVTDGTYLYVLQATNHIVLQEEEDELTFSESACVRVFNKELEEVTVIEMTEQLPLTEFETGSDVFRMFRTTYNCGFRYLGEDIYWCPCVAVDHQNLEIHVFHCKRSDFLAGEPEFEFVYKYCEG